jgi:hypothetical protein
MTRRLRVIRAPAPLAFLALAGLALLVSHDAIFLVQMGPGEGVVRALRTAGHDYWAAASLGLIGAATVAAAITVLRLRALRHRAASLRARPRPPAGHARRVAGTWGPLFAVVAAGFVIQENVEHVIAHSHAIGLGALLSPEYPLALPVIAVITGVAAFVAALVWRTERELVAAIAAALARLARRSRRGPVRPSVIERRRRSVLSSLGASRAPPGMLAA